MRLCVRPVELGHGPRRGGHGLGDRADPSERHRRRGAGGDGLRDPARGHHHGTGRAGQGQRRGDVRADLPADRL